MRTFRQTTAVLAILSLPVLSTPVLAEDGEEKSDYLTSSSPNLAGYIRTFESKKFINSNIKIRGWEVGDEVYMGGAKIGGEYGPGMIFDKGDYAWGFNHRGVAFELRF